MIVKVLVIEDNEDMLGQYPDFFRLLEVPSITSFEPTLCKSFDEGLKVLEEGHYFDLLILDLLEGDPDSKNVDQRQLGLDVLEKLKSLFFAPVIFYTGSSSHIQHLDSLLIKVIQKGHLQDIEKCIVSFIDNNLLLFKLKLQLHFESIAKSFFWDAVHTNQNIYSNVSALDLNYLILRRLANSLTWDNYKVLVGDQTTTSDKIHPLEFYIFPCESQLFLGTIIKKRSSPYDYFVIINPSCDLLRNDIRQPKTSTLHLLKLSQLNGLKFEGIIADLKPVIKNTSGDCFFLPKTGFLPYSAVYFRNLELIRWEELEEYELICRIDSPFAEEMLSLYSKFISRVGTPDLDTDEIIKSIKSSSIPIFP